MKNSFSELGIIPPILKALEDMGFEAPTEVQSRAIPHILNKEDVIVKSKTGSGKTAVFGVSMLQMTDPDAPGPQGLILTPTRELAVQVDKDLKQMAKYLNHKTTAVYGQHSMNVEIQELQKGITILTGTPGRVFDHIDNGTLQTKHIRFLVLDEADRMLDMGFIDQVEKIIRRIPKDRITLLFSATIPDEIKKICSDYMKQPTTIEIESPTKTVDTIKQAYYRVERNEKRLWLERLLLAERPESCMIFCNTKIAVDQVQSFLSSKGYASKALHGDIPQGKRLKTIEQFKKGEFHILVATDVAARGIHIDELSLVVNYDVPQDKDNYIHRIGRTGRAGNEGKALSLVTGDDIMTLYEIEEHIGTLIEEAALPAGTEYDPNMEEVAQWIKNNALKKKAAGAESKSAARKAQKAGERKSSGEKAKQRKRKEKAPSDKSGQQKDRSMSGSRPQRRTGPSKTEASAIKTANEASRPAAGDNSAKAGKTAPRQTPTAPKPVVKRPAREFFEKPEPKKPFLLRLLQSIFRKGK